MWLHGDLHGLNVLAVRGRLSGVLDFGDLCAGDPATDLACGWLLLDHPGRERMREVLDVGDATWARGRGWALFLGLMFLVHSADSPVNGAIGRRTLGEVLDGGALSGRALTNHDTPRHAPHARHHTADSVPVRLG